MTMRTQRQTMPNLAAHESFDCISTLTLVVERMKSRVHIENKRRTSTGIGLFALLGSGFDRQSNRLWKSKDAKQCKLGNVKEVLLNGLGNASRLKQRLKRLRLSSLINHPANLLDIGVLNSA